MMQKMRQLECSNVRHDARALRVFISIMIVTVSVCFDTQVQYTPVVHDYVDCQPDLTILG